MSHNEIRDYHKMLKSEEKGALSAVKRLEEEKSNRYTEPDLDSFVGI